MKKLLSINQEIHFNQVWNATSFNAQPLGPVVVKEATRLQGPRRLCVCVCVFVLGERGSYLEKEKQKVTAIVKYDIPSLLSKSRGSILNCLYAWQSPGLNGNYLKSQILQKCREGNLKVGLKNPIKKRNVWKLLTKIPKVTWHLTWHFSFKPSIDE